MRGFCFHSNVAFVHALASRQVAGNPKSRRIFGEYASLNIQLEMV